MGNSFYIGIDPVIARIGPLVISWYGLMIALAVLLVVGWVVWQNSRTHQLKKKTILAAAAVSIPGGIIFSKVLHVVDQWTYYTQFPGRIFSAEGLTIWGAILGGTLGLWAYSRISRSYSFAALGDMLAPGILLGQALGRIGCTFNGCCYGVESHSPLSVIYTSPNTYAPIGIPILPITVFEIFYVLIAFGVLLWLKDKIKPQGSLFLVYLVLYGGWRFGIDFLRAGTPFLFGLHEAQVIGLLVLVLGLGLLVFKTIIYPLSPYAARHASTIGRT
jgi:phosphatidylglycerol---prolipoprotein diacylglyceryl transferase